MNNYRQLIIAPILTEKSNNAQKENKITFKVKKSADKTTLKIAVEKLFNVEVEDIKTINVSGKVRRKGRRDQGRTSDYKKAIVTLKEGQTIKFD
ncbi:MAG: 50S ribosomal protein L23 [Bacilli bacterium]